MWNEERTVSVGGPGERWENPEERTEVIRILGVAGARTGSSVHSMFHTRRLAQRPWLLQKPKPVLTDRGGYGDFEWFISRKMAYTTSQNISQACPKHLR